VQRGQRVAHPWLRDVPVEVEVEPVRAEPALQRPGLDAGQVDAAQRELGEDHGEFPRPVGDHEHRRRAVGPGRLGKVGRPAQQQEPGHRVAHVGDVGRQHLKRVVGGRDRGRYRGVELTVPHGHRGRRGRRGRDGGRARKVFRQPAPDLGQRVWMTGDRRDAGAVAPRPDQNREADGQHRFADRDQRLALDQRVHGRRHGALDRVLHRHATRVRAADPNRVKHVGHGVQRHHLRRRADARRRLLDEGARGLLGERALRSEVGDS